MWWRKRATKREEHEKLVAATAPGRDALVLAEALCVAQADDLTAAQYADAAQSLHRSRWREKSTVFTEYRFVTSYSWGRGVGALHGRLLKREAQARKREAAAEAHRVGLTCADLKRSGAK